MIILDGTESPSYQPKKMMKISSAYWCKEKTCAARCYEIFYVNAFIRKEDLMLILNANDIFSIIATREKLMFN